METVLSVIGTRPEAIKMAPVLRELSRRTERIRSIVCSTGQHREMLDQVFQLFGITADIELDVMQVNQRLATLTARLLSSLDAVLEQTRPDWVLAQGDTTTAMTTGLVAFYRRVKFGHVEAGLRTGNRQHPFPEEINRRIADLVADLYFAPTAQAARNLKLEGVPAELVHLTGNTVVDALLHVANQPCDWSSGPLASLPREEKLVLITAHRRESFGDPFREMCGAIRELAQRYERNGVHFIYPVHLNPNVKDPVHEILSGLPNVSLIAPLGYAEFVHVMQEARLILTDSGGIQEEAPTFGVPVLVMRETTERPEGVEAGVAKLVGTNRHRIVEEACHVLDNGNLAGRVPQKPNPYGDGTAARKIVSILLDQQTR